MEDNGLQKALALRLRRIRGQLLAVARMAAEEDTTGLLIQLLAVKAALDQASLLVMENHLHHCVEAQTAPDQGPPADAGLMRFIRSYKGASLPPKSQDAGVPVLLAEAAEHTGTAIGLIESFDTGQCSEVLRETAAVRSRVDEVAFRVLEEAIRDSLHGEEGPARDELFATIRMARKFIF